MFLIRSICFFRKLKKKTKNSIPFKEQFFFFSIEKHLQQMAYKNTDFFFRLLFANHLKWQQSKHWFFFHDRETEAKREKRYMATLGFMHPQWLLDLCLLMGSTHRMQSKKRSKSKTDISLFLLFLLRAIQIRRETIFELFWPSQPVW